MDGILSIFSKKIGPVFLKESSDVDDFIEKMSSLQEKAVGQTKEEIQKQIKLAEYGRIGEQNVAFELKNSGMDMYILHDIYLEAGDLSAQIDYIVITRKLIYILECKNLVGDIEINSAGNFLRKYQFGSKKIVEGIYSPITQNQRHLQVLKQVRGASKNNFITKKIFENNFDNCYKSLVVLSNPKTVLNDRYAKKEVKQKVIRADQLIETIRKMDAQEKESMTADYMKELADFFLNQSKVKNMDYAKRFEEALEAVEENKIVTDKMSEVSGEKSKEESSVPNSQQSANTDSVILQLKEFRKRKSREENLKPYMIFNDAQMNDLLEKNPHNKEELLKVSGFGSVKVEKYGECILEILHREDK